MLSIEIAQQLKEAGLKWQPELHDFFAILDHILQSDAIWVPSETQLRRLIIEIGGNHEQHLVSTAEGSELRIEHQGRSHVFAAENGVDALGNALLYLLKEERPVSV